MDATTTIHGLTVAEASRLFWRLRDMEDDTGLRWHARRRATRMVIRLAEAISDAYAA